MSDQPEILFLAHRIPYPPNKGDKIRSWQLLKHLSKHFRVHLACFVDDEADLIHCAFLETICASTTFVRLHPKHALLKSAFGFLSNKPLSVEYYQSAKMRKAVDKIRQRNLTAEIIFSSTMAQYVEPRIGGRVRVVDFCDADSAKWTQYASETKFPLNLVYGREGRLLELEENKIANWADHSFAVTPDEAALFNDRPAISTTIDWWSNGVDTEYFYPASPAFAESPSPEVVFTGAMDYHANVDAILYFAKNVWPLVLETMPEAQLAVVGANPTPAIKALHNKNNTIVAGKVPDVRPWLWKAKVAVAPLRIARGIQNKVLEAMACAKPVVCSPEAAQGIQAQDGQHLMIASEPSQWVEKLRKLLTDKPLRQQLGAEARRHVEINYSWSQRLAPLIKLLRGEPGGL